MQAQVQESMSMKQMMLLWYPQQTTRHTIGLVKPALSVCPGILPLCSSLSPFVTTVLPFLRLLVCATSEDLACGWTPCQGLPQSSSWPPSTSCVGLKLQAKSAHLVFCIPHLAGVGIWPNSSRGTRNGFNGQIPTACQAGLCSMGSEA